MATPLLRCLRRGLPGTRIVVAGNPPYGALLDGLDSFDDFLALDGSAPPAQLLRRAGADVALILPNSWSSAIAPWRARIPTRIGRRNQGRSILLHRSLPPIPGPAPMTELYADFLPAVGLPREVPPVELVAAPVPTTPLPVDTPLLGVAPGAAFGASKCYPGGSLLECLRAAHRDHGLIPVWLGAPGERELLRRLASALPFDSVLPEPAAADLGEAKSLIARCTAILAMDNGARHIAAALQVPQVVLYGPTHPAWSAHGLERTMILRREELDCLGCHHKNCPKPDHPCMRDLSPASVNAALDRVVADAPR
jgi:heptosyltransferase-2